MIKITTSYDDNTKACRVNYSSEKSNTLEHLYAIRCLIKEILKNDDGTDWETIRTILNNTLVEETKETKKNGKRNSKSKTKV